ncbi:MAG TPA: carboxypeptidase regulatory-like domain-containing protein, partial [Candidatus Acidoferrum sp.]|nr:carboxypeptidase regulatory-like domain-containing protein [Candidatus Acidoferrum sp.]
MKLQISKAAGGMRSVAVGTLIAFTLLFSALAAHAQNYAGSVRGTVTDPSSAAVAGAAVTLRDVGTNATSQTTTNEQGGYSFLAVNVGVYEVTVKAGNFKEFIARNVEVHVSTSTEVDAKLELGAATEHVTVEASDIQVQTTTADVGAVIEGTQVRELPLNGRNFMALTQLQPGVSANNGFNTKDKGLQGGADFSVNGNPSTNNLFLVDGVNNNDVGSNRTILIYPSVDSVAEFKMLTNSYGPEYGQASGAIISITTRSGENQFHGGFFYEGRNDKLNANNFANNTFAPGTIAHQKPPLRRNDYGYHIAGPIKKDKLFFWFNEEWNKDNRGNLVTTCSPTAAERGGDFSADVTAAIKSLNAGGQAADNTTCNAPPPANFTNNGTAAAPNWSATSRIPVASQAAGNQYAIANPDAVGKLLAAYYPLPNQTPANYATTGGSDINYATNVVTKAPWREENVRVDYNLTKKNAITFRYTQNAWSIPAPNNAFGWGDDPFATYQGSWNQPSKSIMGRLTTQVSSSLINDFEFGYAHNAILISAQGSSDPGLSAAFDAAMPPAWPAAGKTKGGIPTVWGGLQHYGNFSSIWAIVGYNNDMSLYTYQDNLTKIQGTHAWKFGGLFSANHKNENQFGGGDRPTFGLNDEGWGNIGIVTGNTLANVLLPGTGANPQTIQGVGETNINPVDHGKWHDIEFYTGDTWKFKRNVTLTYGLRWSFLREPYDDTNQMASFSLAAYSLSRAKAFPSDACNGVVVVPGTSFCSAAAAVTGLPLSAGTPGPNRALVENNNHNIAPRLGVAWDIFGTGKTALRVGVGQFYQRERVSPQVGLSNTAPFAITASSGRSLDVSPGIVGASTSPTNGRSPRGIAPNSWQWNVSVEEQLARNTALQVGYVGNVGIHQTTTYNINQVPESGLVLGSFLGSTAQTAKFSSGPAGPVGTACQPGGVYAGGATPTCAYTTPSINALRATPNFGAINYFSRDGHSDYHALQVQFRSKLSNFSQINAAYTWSHTIADFEQDAANGGGSQGSFTDIQNLGIDKGNATVNRPHIFVLNEVFFLPKLANKASFIRESVGGWELNTIFTAESGNSITVYQSGLSAAGRNDTLHILTDPNAPLNCTDSAGNMFPCAISSLSGTGYTNNQRPNTVSGTSCNSGVSGNQIFNPNAFTLIGFHLGSIGNASRGDCHGPHNVNGDIGVYKNWQFKEKYGLRFSMDFFNAFNHSNFDATFIQGTGSNNGSGTYYNG